MEQELVAKYENLGWLKDIEDSKKQELVQLYEDSIALIEKERVINVLRLKQNVIRSF